MPRLSFREAVRDAMSEAMRRDPEVFIIGQDIAEHGGSQKVTLGMLGEFGPERVRNAPISEMALTGAGIGAAMMGMRPIVEIMYQDFLTLAMEQLVNHAALADNNFSQFALDLLVTGVQFLDDLKVLLVVYSSHFRICHEKTLL